MEAVAQALSGCLGIIVMDIFMPQMDWIEATRQILVHYPHTRLLMLSTYDKPDYIRRSIEVGANGYMLKDRVGNDLVSGIRALSAGKHYFSQKVSEMAGREFEVNFETTHVGDNEHRNYVRRVRFSKSARSFAAVAGS